MALPISVFPISVFPISFPEHQASGQIFMTRRVYFLITNLISPKLKSQCINIIIWTAYSRKLLDLKKRLVYIIFVTYSKNERTYVIFVQISILSSINFGFTWKEFPYCHSLSWQAGLQRQAIRKAISLESGNSFWRISTNFE